MPGEYSWLKVGVRADTSRMESDIRTSATHVGDSAGRTMGGKISGALGTIGKTAGFAALAAGAYGVAKGMGFAKTAVIDFNSTLQQADIGFTTMLGSAKKSKAFVADLQDFAKKTPFEFEGLTKNAQTMLGMGIAAKDILPDLKALGDSTASVGGDASTLDGTILAFSQTMSKGTLDMGNMNQMLQGGMPNALKILASSYGKTTGEMVKMISSGKVMSADALPRLVKGIENGTKSTAALGGMMDKQSHTLQGALSNIKDASTQALAGIGKPLFDEVSKWANRVADFLASPTFQHIAEVATQVFGGWMTRLGPLLEQVWPTIKRIFGQLGGSAGGLMDSLHSVFATLGPILAQIGKALGANIGAIMAQLGPILGKLVPIVGQVAGTLGNLLVGALDALLPLWKPLGTLLQVALGLFNRLWRAVAPLIPIIVQVVSTLIAALAPALTVIVRALGSLLGPVMSVVRVIGGALGRVLAMLAPLIAQLLPPIAEIARQLGGVLGSALRQLMPAFQALLPPIVQLIKVIAGQLVGILKALLPILLPLAKLIVQVLVEDLGSVISVVTALLPVVTLLATVVGTVLRVALKILVPVISAVLKVLGKMIGVISTVINWVADLFKWIMGGSPGIIPAFRLLGQVTRTVWNGIKTVIKFVWNNVLHPILAALHDAITAVGGVFRWLYRSIFRPIWGLIRDIFRTAWNSYIHPVLSSFETVLGHVGGALQTLWGVVKFVWNKIAGFIETVWNNTIGKVLGFFHDMPGKIGDAFTALKDLLGDVWGKIRDIVASPVRFVAFQIINPLIHGANFLLDKIGLHIPEIPKFATGGRVPGGWGGGDRQLIMAEPGEWVLTKDQARAIGYGALHGLPRYAEGGPVGINPLWGWNPISAIGGVVSSIGHGVTGALAGLAHMGSDVWNAAVHLFRYAAAKGFEALATPLKHLAQGLADQAVPPNLMQHTLGQLMLNAIKSTVDFIWGKSEKEPSISAGNISLPAGASGMSAVWSALLQSGFSEAQAAGVMGNMMSESGFDPFVVQGGGQSMDPAAAGGGGYGLVQWTPGSKLIPYLHGQPPSIATEIGALVEQLRGMGPSPEGAAGAQLRATTTAAAAAAAFGLGYERYAGGVQTNRAAQAEAIYEKFRRRRYDGGGLLPVGASIAMNHTRRPEPILTAQQWDKLTGAATAGGGGSGLHHIVGGSLEIEPDSAGRLRAWVADVVLEEADYADTTARMGGGGW